ncbi:unnamed protein product [Adineta steineri]|uniref:Uncharacterized protein n=1 Tax=Adineta steineri TaxID=433720 RepID=A0A814D8F6_9BILA|nr:unnamed protein product [Adineta steineri]CAF3666442.1 unnamed protein product [Adineta steineri]
MAFENNSLLVPIWQRTANNILSSIDKYETNENEKENNHIEEIVQKKIDDSNNMFIILDSSVNGKNPLLKMNGTPNNNKQEQYLIILDNNQTVLNKSNLILDEKSQNEFLKPIDSSNSTQSITSSQQSSYIWNKSSSTIENNTQQSQLTTEYNGRMISQSTLNTISNGNQSTKKETWNEHFYDNINTNLFSSNEPHQHIHLSNSNEIYYEKQYDNTDEFYPSSSLSFDRFSTLTYEHINDTTNHRKNQQEEICILYLGPNRCRGFEDNLPIENTSSKVSLITLKSHLLSE